LLPSLSTSQNEVAPLPAVGERLTGDEVTLITAALPAAGLRATAARAPVAVASRVVQLEAKKLDVGGVAIVIEYTINIPPLKIAFLHVPARK